MKLDFFNILSFFVTLFAVANVILYLKVLKGKSRAFRYFTLFLLFTVIILITTTLIGKVFHQPNLFLSNIYLVVQILFLSLFYKELLTWKWIHIVLLIVLGFIAYQYIADPTLAIKYNPLGLSITHVILVGYSIMYFYKSLNTKSEFLIVNIGIFVYLLSSSLIFASGNLVLDLDISDDTRFMLINVNRFLFLTLQFLIFIEWYKNYRIKKSNDT